MADINNHYRVRWFGAEAPEIQGYAIDTSSKLGAHRKADVKIKIKDPDVRDEENTAIWI